METKMKKLFFVIFFQMFFFNCSKENKMQSYQIKEDKMNEIEIFKGGFIENNAHIFTLKLPYRVSDEIDSIFNEDTPLAIDIVEIYADGKKLYFVEDRRLIEVNNKPYFRIDRIVERKKEYFIFMDWYLLRSAGVLCWNDGRGLIITDNNVYTNTYEISRDVKKLEIKYRIVLPYPTLTIENLFDIKYQDKRYTKSYMIIVNISNI